jgi:hypothetical protein
MRTNSGTDYWSWAAAWRASGVVHYVQGCQVGKEKQVLQAFSNLSGCCTLSIPARRCECGSRTHRLLQLELMQGEAKNNPWEVLRCEAASLGRWCLASAFGIYDRSLLFLILTSIVSTLYLRCGCVTTALSLLPHPGYDWGYVSLLLYSHTHYLFIYYRLTVLSIGTLTESLTTSWVQLRTYCIVNRKDTSFEMSSWFVEWAQLSNLEIWKKASASRDVHLVRFRAGSRKAQNKPKFKRNWNWQDKQLIPSRNETRIRCSQVRSRKFVQASVSNPSNRFIQPKN